MSKDYHKLYASNENSARSLNSYKKKLLNEESEVTDIYQTENEGKLDKWIGYESDEESEPRQRLDSESEDEENEKNEEKIVQRAIFDENSEKVQVRERIGKADVKWLGAKPDRTEKIITNKEELQAGNIIHRDKQGRILEGGINKEQELKKLNEERLNQWKSGAEQRKEKEDMIRNIKAEKNKPFARYEIEEDADQEFKTKKRFGDPALAFQENRLKKMKTECPYSWENRFNIKPGSKWDGRDRSNEFERRWMAKQGRKEWEKSFVYKQFASEL
ncbi:unnamed protein product [Blepharisma stoltei]|uniref:Pre-mRNA-splicing factor CWC26 n=1 Tax=Blepharisma stoltei TaxID=1481888 RepID=A0AAU9JWT1_9CILI|nr:unnamed protein product [Blepharisma stoltei]